VTPAGTPMGWPEAFALVGFFACWAAIIIVAIWRGW